MTALARHLIICPLLALGLLSPAIAADDPPTGSAFADVPDAHAVVTVALGELRLANQTHRFTTIPDPLAGLTAISPHRGPSTSEPGPAYQVRLTRPGAVYLAVHDRGNPTVPDGWAPTGLTLGWGNHQDDIYARLIDAPTTLDIPAHDGRAGGFGVPHMVLFSPDTDTARRLIADPVARRSAIQRPGRVVVVLPDADQPGLYAHPGDTVRFRLRHIPGTGGPAEPLDQLTVSLAQLDGDFTWATDAPLDDTGHTDVLEVAPPAVGFYPLHIAADDQYPLAPFAGGVGIVPEPAPVNADSPWGVMRVGDAPWEARLARMLGVDWVRHSNWNMVRPRPRNHADEGTSDATRLPGVDLGRFGELAEMYHEQGIHIMASLSLVPSELSSQPGDTSQSGDAGPLESRVAPADWDAWQRFVRDTAAALPMIDHWEIGNEPNTPHHYWAGTVEEFARLMQTTAAGVREANPDATILAAGYTLNPSAATYLDRLLELAAGDSFDVLSVHSLYAKALSVGDMRAVLQRHGLDRDMPVWSTEPKHVLPLRNFAAGVERNMHFMLVNPGAYGDFQNLAERDGAATRWGVAFAIVSDLIDDAAFDQLIHTGLPDVELGRFTDDAGRPMLVAAADEGPRGAGVRVRAAASGDATPTYSDLMGGSLSIEPNAEFLMPLDRSGILHGAADVQVLGIEIDPDAAGDPGIEVTADDARLMHGFVARSDEARPAYAAVWADPANADTMPEVHFPFTIEEPGTYEVYLAAMWYPSHAGSLVSPFAWSIDGRNAMPAPPSATVHWRRSTRTHLRFGQVAAEAGRNVPQTQTLARLGTVRNLQPGEHTVQLRLLGPRGHDQHLSMEVESIALRRITDDRE
jgi:hypothetical protein